MGTLPRRGQIALGLAVALTAAAAGVRAAVGRRTTEEAEQILRSVPKASTESVHIALTVQTAMDYGWLVFAVVAAIAAMPILVSGAGRAFAGWVVSIFGLSLLVLGIGVPAPVTAVHLLTWLAGVVTIATLLLMMLAASAENQRPTRRPRPVSRRG